MVGLLSSQAAKLRVAWSEAVVALNGRGGGAWGGEPTAANGASSNGHKRRSSRHAAVEGRRAG